MSNAELALAIVLGMLLLAAQVAYEVRRRE